MCLLTVFCGPLQSGSAVLRNAILKYLVITIISSVSV